MILIGCRSAAPGRIAAFHSARRSYGKERSILRLPGRMEFCDTADRMSALRPRPCACRSRSAELHSAVSPSSTRPGVRSTRHDEFPGRDTPSNIVMQQSNSVALAHVFRPGIFSTKNFNGFINRSQGGMQQQSSCGKVPGHHSNHSRFGARRRICKQLQPISG